MNLTQMGQHGVHYWAHPRVNSIEKKGRPWPYGFQGFAVADSGLPGCKKRVGRFDHDCNRLRFPCWLCVHSRSYAPGVKGAARHRLGNSTASVPAQPNCDRPGPGGHHLSPTHSRRRHTAPRGSPLNGSKARQKDRAGPSVSYKTVFWVVVLLTLASLAASVLLAAYAQQTETVKEVVGTCNSTWKMGFGGVLGLLAGKRLP
jgi:hypothetical protein